MTKTPCNAGLGRYSTHLPSCPAFGSAPVWGEPCPTYPPGTVLGPALPTFDDRYDAAVEWGVKHGLRHQIERIGASRSTLVCHTCGQHTALFSPTYVTRPAETDPMVLSASRFD